MNRLQIIQNEALRVLLEERNKFTPTQELLQRSGHISINQMAATFTLTTAKKLLLNDNCDHKITKKLTVRNETKYLAPRTNTFRAEEDFSHKATRLLNKLPREIIEEANPRKYKKMIKKWTAATIPIR